MSGPVVIDAASVPDAGAFVARVLRLDPQALVRLRGPELWAMLPFGVLVTRRVATTTYVDATFRARDLLATLGGLAGLGGADPIVVGEPLRALPDRHDAAWLWGLPPGPGRVVEALPGGAVRQLSAAAAATVRAAERGGVGGRAVGSRALRDALLDHVPIVVTTDDGARVAVPQRLVQAMTRMDFVPVTGDAVSSAEAQTPIASADDAAPVVVRIAGPWVGLAGVFGAAWYRPSPTALGVRPTR